jgi:CRP-like cAMP-binding protein
MIQREFAAHRDEADARQVRGALARELSRHVPFLASASPTALDDIAAAFVEERLPRGQLLFEEGTGGDAFFLIRSGRLELLRGGEKLAELSVGQYLGEGALLTDTPRSASARALTDCQLFRMGRRSFTDLIARHPSLRQAVVAIHEERRLDELHGALRREWLGKVPFLKEASTELLDALAGALAAEGRRVWRAGEIVFNEGSPADGFYVIGSGGVAIDRGGERVAQLGPGGFFGEGALLSGGPRAARAVVTTDTALYRLSAEAFDSLLERFSVMNDVLRQAHAARRFPAPAS